MRRRAWVAAIALISVCLGAAPAGAQAEPVTLEAVPGFDGFYRRGTNTPVAVTIEATQPLDGELVVSAMSQGLRGVQIVPVELAAGSRKRVSLIYPDLYPSGIRVRFRAEGATLAEERLELTPVSDTMLIATTVPTIESGLSTITTTATALPVRFTSLDDDVLALGPAALDGLTSIMVGEEGAAFSDTVASDLLRWASAGNDLIVAVEDPGDASWVPGADRIRWEGSDDALRARAGRGATQVGVGARVTVGMGSALIVPRDPEHPDTHRLLSSEVTPPTALMAESWRVGEAQTAGRVADGLQPRESRRVRLGGFVFFLLGYLVLIGPVNYLLLRKRGRKELAWVTIPVVALLFTGIAYGLVRGTAGERRVRHGTVVFATEAGARARTVVAISSGAGGDHLIGFDTGIASASFQGPFQSGRGVVRHTDGGTEVDLETGPFSLGVAHGETSGFEGFIESSVSATATSVSGTVTNRTPHDLFEVQLWLGGRVANLGELGSGESIELEETSTDPQDRRRVFGSGGRLRSSLGDSLGSVLPDADQNQLALVTGFTHGHSPSVSLDGSDVTPRGATLVASPLSTGSVLGNGNAASSVSGNVTLAHVDGGSAHPQWPGSFFLEGFNHATFVFELPTAGRAPRSASFSLSGGGPRVDISAYDWGINGWVSIGDTRLRGNEETFALPPGAVSATGRGFVRVTPNREPFMDVSNVGVRAELS